MNVKEFKKRWLRGYVEPELFYLPVEDTTEYDPMVIRVVASEGHRTASIEVSVNYVQVFNILNTNSNTQYGDGAEFCEYIKNKSYNMGMYYNYSTEDGIMLNEKNFPNYFNKLEPWEKDLYVQSKPYLKIDWGDGTESECTAVPNTGSLEIEDGVTATGYTLNSTDLKNATTHDYEKDGEYIISIYGNIANLSFNYLTNVNFKNYTYATLTEVIKWGNLGLRGISNLLNRGSNNENKIKIPLLNYSFSHVHNAQSAFYYCDITWNDLGGEDCLKYFPNLTNAISMFYGTNVNCIPDYFTLNNKNLISIDYMFNDTPIEYIGDYAFANLPILCSAFDIGYCGNMSSYKNYQLKRIGNSIFENDVNLFYVDCFAYVQSYYSTEEYHPKLITKIGDNIFKNCTSLKIINNAIGDNFYLEEVGEGLFDGCIHLQYAPYLFSHCFSLKKIGKNVFRGCKSLRYVVCMFYDTIGLELPDNLFYDLEYDPKLDNNFYCRDLFYMQIGINKNNNNKYTMTIDGLYYRNDYFDEELYNSFYSLGYDNLPMIKLGKNMFNPTFLQDLISHYCYFDNNRTYPIQMFHNVVYYWEYNDKYDSHSGYLLTDRVTKAKVLFSGEVPELWKYPELFKNMSLDDGSRYHLFEYTNQSGTITYTCTYIDQSTGERLEGDTFTEEYLVEKGKWDNASSIPLPVIKRNPNGTLQRYDFRWLQIYAPVRDEINSEVIIIDANET